MSVGLHQLRYFVTVAEEGNVSRAAVRLHIAQPSLSAQIKQLERNLGVTLFRRHPRGVELTRAGTMFLVEARAALRSADAAVSVARMAARGEAGSLRKTMDKFLQHVAAGEVVGLAEASVAQAFARPGVRFVPVLDVEPVTTELGWRASGPNPLVDGFVAVAREAL